VLRASFPFHEGLDPGLRQDDGCSAVTPAKVTVQMRKRRHPGEGRGPVVIEAHWREKACFVRRFRFMKSWILAYARMTGAL
jgi:hypothetical protein